MTLSIDPVLAADLLLAGFENNPIVAHLNLAATATVTTVTGSEVAAAANAVSGATYNFWRATPNGSDIARIEFDLGSAQAVSFAGIAAHNLADTGATVTLRYSSDGSSWTNSAAPAATPADNRAIGFRFAEVTRRYWQLSVTNAGDDVIVGVALLSRELVLPSRLYRDYAPPITPTVVDLQSNVSEGGHLLGSSQVRRGSMASVRINHLPPSEIRSANWRAFQAAYNGGAGFFWHWRPAKYPGDLFYAWRSGAPLVPVNSGPRDFMSIEMAMRFHDEP